MKFGKVLLALRPALMLVALGACAQTGAAGDVHEVQVRAKKYAFSPKVITVKKGERVSLTITALDRDHGFKLDAFKIDQKLKQGDPTTIEFTADKAGTYSFRCSDFCGMGHLKMKGRLVVEEQ